MPKIVKGDQRTPSWHHARLGSVGGSTAPKILPGKKMAMDLVFKLAAEVLLGQPLDEGFRSAAMQRGIDYEDEAIETYSFLTDRAVQRVSLVVGANPGTHYSPDGLVGDDGILEVKVQYANGWLKTKTLGLQKADKNWWLQCQYGMWVCQRNWVDFGSYCPELGDMYVERVLPCKDTQWRIYRRILPFTAQVRQVISDNKKEI